MIVVKLPTKTSQGTKLLKSLPMVENQFSVLPNSVDGSFSLFPLGGTALDRTVICLVVGALSSPSLASATNENERVVGFSADGEFNEIIGMLSSIKPVSAENPSVLLQR